MLTLLCVYNYKHNETSSGVWSQVLPTLVKVITWSSSALNFICVLLVATNVDHMI